MAPRQGTTIGERIEAARKSAGLTQVEVAARITKATGVELEPRAVERWETGYVKRFSLERLEQIASALGCTVAELTDPQHAVRAAS